MAAQRRGGRHSIHAGSPDAGATRRRLPTVLAPASIAREQRADDTHAAAAHDVDLDARLVQRAQHARVIGAARPVAAQQNRGSQLW